MIPSTILPRLRRLWKKLGVLKRVVMSLSYLVAYCATTVQAPELVTM